MDREKVLSGSIFYSWQSDKPPATNRTFVEKALEQALKELSTDAKILEPERPDLVLEKDTKNVAGMPPIADTIFAKIDLAAAFVADMTFVASREKGGSVPNPNVLIEYGYARRALTHARLLAVMNVHYGKPSALSLPFDMIHVRWPVQYNLAPDASSGERTSQKKQLVSDLKSALGPILQAALSQPVKTEPFELQAALDGPARFVPPGKPLGRIRNRFGEEGSEAFLRPGPCRWLRVYPLAKPAQQFLRTELLDRITHQTSFQVPLAGRAPGYYSFLGKHCAGNLAISADGLTADSVAFFESGEVWAQAVDHHSDRKTVSVNELSYESSLNAYSQFLETHLGIPKPHAWEAGMDGIEGWLVWRPGRKGEYRSTYEEGPSQIPCVLMQGQFRSGDRPLNALKPFYKKLYDAFGVKREDWFDDETHR